MAVTMKNLIAVCVILWTCACPAMPRTLHEYEASVAKTHEQWMQRYGRTYADDAEKEKRFNIFMENLKFIENFNNAGNRSYELGLNKFADLTHDEFIASYTGFKVPSLPRNSSKMPSVAPINQLSDDVPTSMDWRDEGAVTPVKDQGYCESCWAFSAVAAVEGIVKIKTGNSVLLSEQQLVDCAINAENQGCGPGFMDNAFEYIIRNNGIASENDYPYQGIAGTCSANGIASAAQISSYVEVPKNSEEQLLQAVANQPVSVPIAVSDEFRFFKGGSIFKGPCGERLNHGVTAIGYGTDEDGTKYWLIKNSWGESWGENGYMKLQRESGDTGGLCGIAEQASYPTIN